MSASYVVDLGNTTLMGVSIISTPVLSGALVAPCSGAIIGMGVDFLRANSFCNLFLAGVSASGQMRIQVQTSDTDVSGLYTDPTSGVAGLPGAFQSGGILWINTSGLSGGVIQPLYVSGQQALASGFMAAQGFQRPQRFVRANLLSGDFAAGGMVIGFISQLKTDGSGAGFSYSPQPATPVNV